MIQSAHIIAIGDEVLAGETINTNAAWMAQFLLTFGIRPVFQCVVPDEPLAIQEALSQALASADLAVLFGGLGPTADDRTLDAVGAALGRPVIEDAAVRAHVEQRHSRVPGREASVARQSRIVIGAHAWMNPRGQAPGQLLEVGGRYIVLLPGPPREMQGIAEKWMASWVAPLAASRIHRDTYSVFDLGESQVATHLSPLLEGQHPRAGIYAQPGRVDVRIDTADSAEGRVLRQRGRAWVLSRVPAPVFELGEWSRERFLIEWLAGRRWSLAAMESLTGGQILATLISVPGASQGVVGGVVAYTDAVKESFGVPRAILDEEGAVSEACAVAMAQAAREQFHADVAVSSTGFAGPDGGTEKEPVGTFYVAAAGPMGTVVRRRYTPLDRQAVRQVAVQTAMSAVWELLKLPTLLKNLEIS